MPYNLCAHRKLRSVCAIAQSDQNLRRPPEEALDHLLATVTRAKPLISLHKLGIHVIRYILPCCNPYIV